jgi:hypothetical protein
VGAHPVALPPPAGARQQGRLASRVVGASQHADGWLPPGSAAQTSPPPSPCIALPGRVVARIVRRQRLDRLAGGRHDVDAQGPGRQHHVAGALRVGNRECRAGRRVPRRSRSSGSWRIADSDVLVVDAEVAHPARGFTRASVGLEHCNERVRSRGHTESRYPRRSRRKRPVSARAAWGRRVEHRTDRPGGVPQAVLHPARLRLSAGCHPG